MDYQKLFIDLLKKKVGNKEISATTNLRLLGIDSLDLVEIVMDAEEEFGITFTNEELNSFKIVEDVVKAAQNKKVN